MNAPLPRHLIRDIEFPGSLARSPQVETPDSDENETDKARKTSFRRRLFLKPVDVGFLVLSSLMINIFALALPLVTLQVYDRILAHESVGTLQVLCAGVGVILVLDILVRVSRSRLIGWTSARFEHAAYTGALKQLMTANLDALGKHSSGEQLHRLSAVAKLKSFYSGQSLTNLIDLPFVLIFLGFIAYLSGWLVAVPAGLLTLFGGYAIGVGRSIKHALKTRDMDDDNRINFVSEVLDNIHTVKMLGLELALQRRHEAMQGTSTRNAHGLHMRSAHSQNTATLFTQIMMVTMISIGALMVVNGLITMGILIACVLLSGRVMQPVQRALSFWVSFQEYRLARDKMDQLFALPTQTRNAPDLPATPRGKLEIRNLGFSYTAGGTQVFHGLDLTLGVGRTISLGGPPGDGKTTLLKLIAGLYEPTEGQILIDGVPTCRIPPGEIAKYIGYLPAEAEIFQGSIIDNLTGFRPEMEKKALEMVAHLGIDTVVSKLSHGYQTMLCDGPADPLTPGMKQRITICRVLVNRPRLLLFDFADRSLDKDGYNHLFRLLGQLKGQASMILVSNDRNILHLAQEEYVFEDGALVPVDDSRYSKSDHVVQTLQELRG